MTGVHHEADLWSRAQAGDTAARNRVLEQVEERSRACLSGQVPAHDLEDLVQRTGLSVLGFMDRGGAVRDFATFAKFRALGVLSAYRKEKRTLRSQMTIPLGDEGHGESAPMEILLRSELVEAFRSCRDSLADALRQPFDMRWAEGVETPLVAERLGVTPNAVHIRLFKARQAIRECLRSKGFDERDLP